MKWSPDGKWLITIDGDKRLKLWNTTNWTELATLHGHQFCVTNIFWNPDSNQFHTLDASGVAFTWDGLNGTQIKKSLHNHQSGMDLFGKVYSKYHLINGDVFILTTKDTKEYNARRDFLERSFNELNNYHEKMIKKLESEKDWLGVVFHLNQFLKENPNYPALHSRLETAKNHLKNGCEDQRMESKELTKKMTIGE